LWSILYFLPSLRTYVVEHENPFAPIFSDPQSLDVGNYLFGTMLERSLHHIIQTI